MPELAFHEGELLSVGKESGWSARWGAHGGPRVTKAPTSPGAWEQLTQELFESVSDSKVSNSYVSNKAGFEAQSGGLKIQEVQTWTPGLKPHPLPEGPGGSLGVAGAALAVGIAALTSSSAKEFVENSILNIAITNFPCSAVSPGGRGSALGAWWLLDMLHRQS